MTDTKPTLIQRLDAWSKAPPKVRYVTPPSQRKPLPPSRLQRWTDSLGASCAGARLADGWLSYKGKRQRLEGLTIHVESAGGVDRRATLTRTAVGGLAFGGKGAIVGALAKKKIDNRELYLIVDGPAFAWSIPVPASQGAAARAFAAKVSTAAK